MHQQSTYRPPGMGAQPPAPVSHVAGPSWEWAPAVMGGGATAAAQAYVPPMRTRDGVAGLAIGLCVLAAALAAGIGFTVRETQPPAPAPTALGEKTKTPAPEKASPLAADGHAHTH